MKNLRNTIVILIVTLIISWLGAVIVIKVLNQFPLKYNTKSLLYK